ncbi:glycoside hydrolase N-terminal domain-containing protein [Paenibacillus sp. OV219]|uniref:glycosyl hydrolase family 95 catalytic domain-containing protein n=1 Tax=Paenibacillus sp. OV219 TaxID=1884377 RepID=UPI0008BAEDE4|nr:glycoside hydrolase N-terminal domain-containing protein [Paenibacillus sp. OV219]SEO89843.1 alpha-L-fucosidase 2 [Paenibacillus sp. OV219]
MSRPIKIPCRLHNLVFNQPINRWDEALPLGNGLTGCLVWGNGAPLCLSLDRGDLWDTRLVPEVQDEGFTYRNLIELVRNGDQQQITRRFSDFFSEYPNPTKLPAGRIEFHGPAAETMSCEMHLREAMAEVTWEADGKSHRLETFLHAENGLGYIRISSGGGRDQLLFKLMAPVYTNSSDLSPDSLALLDYPGAEYGSEDGLSWFLQRTSHELEYAIVVAECKTSERTTEWVYLVAANHDGDDWFERAKSKVRAAVQTGFDAAFPSHFSWWKRYWQKSEIMLPDFEMEQQWYLTNYLFGSCSRKGAPPMPLQGVWTADEGKLPPWKGDYHHDLNTELSYWHYLKANHLEEGESFLDFLWKLRPAAREFAQSYYETDGINLPSVMTIDGKPLGGWPMYSLSPTNQIWQCHAFDQYWLYTGDREFLETKTYVYFKETALCILDLLVRGDDGKLKLPISSSPEIHDDSLDSWLTPNSNYDLALLRYLFARLTQMSELLGMTEDFECWSAASEVLPELAVDESGFMLSPDERLLESHRHFSHAMAIYPLQTVDYHRSEAEKKIIDDTIARLEVLGKGMWVGYSFAWMAALYTRQGNGEAARYHLQQFWEHLCSPNGFHLNGDFRRTGLTQFHYRPFTLEGNMAAADALQEMLLQTNGGIIRPFAAVPNDWLEKGVEFQRFRGEMGILISAKAVGGRLDYVHLQAERGGVFLLENRFDTDKLTVERDGAVTVLECRIGGVCPMLLEAGDQCTVRGAS